MMRRLLLISTVIVCSTGMAAALQVGGATITTGLDTSAGNIASSTSYQMAATMRNIPTGDMQLLLPENQPPVPVTPPDPSSTGGGSVPDGGPIDYGVGGGGEGESGWVIDYGQTTPIPLSEPATDPSTPETPPAVNLPSQEPLTPPPATTAEQEAPEQTSAPDTAPEAAPNADMVTPATQSQNTPGDTIDTNEKSTETPTVSPENRWPRIPVLVGDPLVRLRPVERSGRIPRTGEALMARQAPHHTADQCLPPEEGITTPGLLFFRVVDLTMSLAESSALEQCETAYGICRESLAVAERQLSEPLLGSAMKPAHATDALLWWRYVLLFFTGLSLGLLWKDTSDTADIPS